MTEKRYSLGKIGCYRTKLIVDNETKHEIGNSVVVKRLNALHEENIKVSSLIDEKIDYLQKKYDFGQNVYHGCPMHNIMHSINTLKEIKKEMGWE